MKVQEALGLAHPPIAVGFLDRPPGGVGRRTGPAAPAGCAFWREALAGKAFYTEMADHANCAVGAYTHGAALPELQSTVEFMIGSGYLRPEEVGGIPALSAAPRYVAYAPADAAPFPPDVVLVAAAPAAAMLLYEASLRAGAAEPLTPALGRPGCAVLPLAVKTGLAALSFGCRGNRTFTGLPDGELYLAIPGARWPAVVRCLAEIVNADNTMREYYQDRQEQFPVLA